MTQLIERLGRLVHNQGHAQGLKPTQWEMLRYLAQANRFSRTPSSVTLYMNMTKGTVSQSLSTLQRKGLVNKHVDPADRRAVSLSLSPAAIQLLENDPLKHLDMSIGAASPALQAELETTLRQTLLACLKAQGGRPFGLCAQCVHFRKDARNGHPHYCSLLSQPLSQDDSQHICAEQVPA